MEERLISLFYPLFDTDLRVFKDKIVFVFPSFKTLTLIGGK